MKLIVGYMILWFASADHDIKMARFRVEKQTSGYEISVAFDRVDILEAVYSQPVERVEVIEQIEAYVKPRVTYRIDGRAIPYQFESIEYTKENIILTGTIKVPIGRVDEIEVENTCLIQEIDGHLNIMEFFMNDNKRYFRLHEGRTKTTVTYE